MKRFLLAATALIGAAFLATACGGGSTATPAAAITTKISGNAVKGPVSGATVTVRAVATGAVLGTTTTTAGGAYNLDVSYEGDVSIDVVGGTYTDEATGQTTALSTPMRTVLAANGGSVVGMVTPLTTVAFSQVVGTMSASAFNSAASGVAIQFGLGGTNIINTLPSVTGTTNTYGLVLRGVSQYIATNGGQLSAFTGATVTQLTNGFSVAYNQINPGNPLTFTFTANANGGGTIGVGGGGITNQGGQCRVEATGNISVSVAGINTAVPISLTYCIQGAGSCDAQGIAGASQQINQAFAAAGPAGGQVSGNLSFSYAAACQGNELINLNIGG